MLKTLLFYLAALLIAIAITPMPPHARAANDQLLVIMGASFPGTDVSFAILKEAFRGRAATLEGRRLVPINHPIGSPERIAFDRLVLKLKPTDVGAYWIDVKIRDEGRPPATAASAELAVRIVASVANAISCTRKELLSPKVKVLTIDGKSANDAGYALAN